MRFFLSDHRVYTPVVYFGGSITGGNEYSSWRALTRKWIADKHYVLATTHINSAYGGTASWFGLVRLQDDVISHDPALLFVDFAVNDSEDMMRGDRPNKFAPAAEALIRRMWALIPDIYLLGLILCFPNDYSHMNDTRRAARDKWIALLNHYGLPPVRFDERLETLMPSPYTDADVDVYFLGSGDPHLTTTGNLSLHEFVIEYLDQIEGNMPTTLPARYYAESEDYEYAPIIRNGINNDGETGTGWSTVDTTARESSTAGDTISWTGTFCSFGLDYNDTASGVLEWQLDGGAWTSYTLGARPVALSNFTRGVHTITLKVVSGTIRINRFLAI